MTAALDTTTTDTTTPEEVEPAPASVVVELMKALGHPIRVGILRELARAGDGGRSPGEMADRRKGDRRKGADSTSSRDRRHGAGDRRKAASAGRAPLGVVSYHVRMLRDYGAVELLRTEPRRGALQHFYVARAEVQAMLRAFDRVAKVTGEAQAVRAAGESGS